MFRKPVKISLPSPCNVPWESMTPLGTANRHCASCDKVIVDFTQLSDAELLAHFKNTDRVCGRFSPAQLDRQLVLKQSHAKNTLWQKLVLLPSLLLTAPAIAQTQKTAEPVRQLQPGFQGTKPVANETSPPQKKLTIEGTVTDSTKEAVIGAVILVHYGEDSAGCTTDFDGHYSLTISCNETDSVALEVKMVGYFPFQETIPAGTAAGPLTFNVTLVPRLEIEPVTLVCGGAIATVVEPRRMSRPRYFFYRLFHWRRYY